MGGILSNGTDPADKDPKRQEKLPYVYASCRASDLGAQAQGNGLS
jgi:hypothetical protein